MHQRVSARLTVVTAVVIAVAVSLLVGPADASAVAAPSPPFVSGMPAVTAGAGTVHRPATHGTKHRCGKHKVALKLKPSKKKRKKAKLRCVRVRRKIARPAPSVQTQMVRAATKLPAVRVAGKTYPLQMPSELATTFRLGIPRLPASMFTTSGPAAASGVVVESGLPPGKDHAVLTIPETGATLTLDTEFGSGMVQLRAHVTLGSESAELYFGLGADVDSCPTAGGKVHGKATYGVELHLDAPRSKYKGEWPLPGPPDSHIILHLVDRADATGVARVTDQAKAKDFDLQGRSLDFIQIGTKSAAGTVLQTNEPKVLQVDAAVQQVPREPEGTGKAFVSWLVDALTRSQVNGRFRGSDWGGEDKANELWQKKWAAAIALFGLTLNNTERDHWQKVGDCLAVQLKAKRTTLRPGQSTKVTATLVPKTGPKTAKAALTMKTTAGTLDPDTDSSAKPVTFRFTAPRKNWDHATVTVRAVSKQGIGTGEITLSRQRDTYQLVFSTDLRQTFTGNGTGSAHWVGTAKPLLKEGPDGVWTGSAGYGWSTFQYAKHGDPMVCQAGGYGHDDIDAAGTKPGRLTVPRLTGADGGASALAVQLRVQAPIDTLRQSFFHDGTTCADFTSTYDWSIWPPLRWQLADQPGVTMTGSGNEDSALFTITGWHKGTGSVLAYKDIAWTQSGGSENYHLRLELRAQGMLAATAR